MNKLRSYQLAINGAVNTFLNDPTMVRGQIHAPTGAGKTECFIHTINDYVNNFHVMIERFGVPFKQLRILIGHPRIALSQDQLERFKKSLGNQRYHYTSFHSGLHHKIGGEGNTEGNTTDVDDVIKYAAINATKHQIVFSSYHSIDKLNSITWDLIICDEGHNLTNSNFDGYARRLNGRKILFYTATPVLSRNVTDEDRVLTMSNPDIYGLPIHQLEPNVLIREGYIIPPMVHFQNVETNEGDTDDNVDPVACVVEAFKYQATLAMKHGMPYHQMLVASSGRSDIIALNDGFETIRQQLGDPTLQLITVMSDSQDDGSGVWINGVKSDKDRFVVLDDLKSRGGNAIVAHFDTLAEGIDINTLTGVFVMRALSKVKMIQTIGRTARPYVGDLDPTGNPIFLYGMKANDDKRKKRYSVLSFLMVNGQLVGGDDISVIVDAFVNGGYGDLAMYHETQFDDRGHSIYRPSEEIVRNDPTIVDIVACVHRTDMEAIKKSGLYSDLFA